jgi:hypothetical protein
VLEERDLQTANVHDATTRLAAAFGGWTSGARVCRIANLDGREVGPVVARL